MDRPNHLICHLIFHPIIPDALSHPLTQHIVHIKGKGKTVPLQAWSGPEGSRKLRFPDFMTTVQDGGKVVSLAQWPPLLPGKAPGTHFC